jgi:hypothetical protein
MRLFPATLWLALMAWVGMTIGAVAQHHHHPTETITGEVGKFYETWMRPDMPHVSCCNLKDCYATAAKFENGRWRAQRREDGKWLTIPESKIERNRDMPDGRAHLCAATPHGESSYENGVICFGVGSGS